MVHITPMFRINFVLVDHLQTISCTDLMKNSCLFMQSYITDFSTLLDNSGLNSWIYAVLTASFVVAGFSYQFLPVDTMNAIFGMSVEKGLEDVYLWQLIGGGIATGVAPIAFTQRVCFAVSMLPSASALTYSLCFNKSCMVQSKSTVRYSYRAIYPGSYHMRLHAKSACNLHVSMLASASTNVLVGSLLCTAHYVMHIVCNHLRGSRSRVSSRDSLSSVPVGVGAGSSQ